MRKTSKYRKPEFWLQLLANVCGALLATGIFLPDSLGAKLVAAGILVLANLGYVAPIAARGVRRVLVRAVMARSSHRYELKGLRGPDGGHFESGFYFEEADGMYRLTTALIYITASGEIITVPLGFLSDGFSIPALIKWMFWGIDGKYLAAAFIHDYLYSTQTHKRAWADKVLREAMLALGATEFLANIIYVGVRGGGWIGWAIDADEAEEVAAQSDDLADIIAAAETEAADAWADLEAVKCPSLTLCRHAHEKLLQLRWRKLHAA